jgi:hypothetical protein
MPTTQDEAFTIATLVCKYLPMDKAKVLAAELYENVGRMTSNKSLRTTLEMLKQVFDDKTKLTSGRSYVHSIDGKSGLKTYG